jgi:MFS family permease
LSKREVTPPENLSRKFQPFLSREALPPAIIAFMLNIIWGSLSAFFPLYALKHGVLNPGIFFIFLATTLFLGRILGGRILDIYRREKVIMPCFILIVLSIAILVFSTTLAMFILAAVVLGMGWALLYPFLMIHAIENAGFAQGPAMATFTALADLGAGLGPMIMGFILELMGYPVMLSCLILTAIINFIYFYYSIGKKAGAGNFLNKLNELD